MAVDVVAVLVPASLARLVVKQAPELIDGVAVACPGLHLVVGVTIGRALIDAFAWAWVGVAGGRGGGCCETPVRTNPGRDHFVACWTRRGGRRWRWRHRGRVPGEYSLPGAEVLTAPVS